jgi:hypothetical protein
MDQGQAFLNCYAHREWVNIQLIPTHVSQGSADE